MRYASTAVALSTALVLLATLCVASSPPPTRKDDPAADTPRPKAEAPPKGNGPSKEDNPPSQKEGPKDAKAPAIAITEKDLGKKFTVKPGDVVEVRLPFTIPYTWTWPRSLKGIRPLPSYPKEEFPPGKGKTETLGGPMLWVGRFEMTGKPETPIPLSLIYCLYIHKEAMSQASAKGTIVPPEAWDKLNAQPLQEGAMYQVALDVKH
jgi:hypothetical protein